MKLVDYILGMIVYGLFWFVHGLYSLIPARRAYGFGCAFASLIYPFFPKRRRLAIDNILKAKITDNPVRAAEIAKASWCHLAGHICEALKVPSVINAENYREHLDFADVPESTARLLLDETDEPILLVSSHHGTWEAATNTISFARPMIAIARTMNNKYAAAWMSKHHFRGPTTVIDKSHGFTTDILRKWKNECSAMTILIDQHYSKGPLLEFFGRSCRCITSATRLAIRTNYRIVCGSFVRIAPFKYRLVGGEPLRFDKSYSVEEATQIMNDRLADAIRKYPEQYLWFHRRWR